MTHEEKVEWMAMFAVRNNLKLELEGEVGIGRECVGVSDDGLYPDYEWRDDQYERIDPNGDVWTPPDAYHKHACVAVLGRDEKAEAQLYDWLRWFVENDFRVERGSQEPDPKLGVLAYLLRQDRYLRMVRTEGAARD